MSEGFSSQETHFDADSTLPDGLFNNITAPDSTPHTIIVDDEPILRMVMKVMVGHALPNSTHTDYDDGEPAFDHLMGMASDPNHRVDLIISDRMMPKMGGLELYRSLRSTPAFKTTPFVLTSGGMPDHDMHALRGHLESDSSLRFLPKPFGLDELSATVDSLMQTRQNVAEATSGIRILE